MPRCFSAKRPSRSNVVHAQMFQYKKITSPKCCLWPDISVQKGYHVQMLFVPRFFSTKRSSTSKCCQMLDVSSVQKGYHTQILSMPRCFSTKRPPCPNIVCAQTFQYKKAASPKCCLCPDVSVHHTQLLSMPRFHHSESSSLTNIFIANQF